MREEIVGGNETILFVEDEPALLELMKMQLESKGYDVLTATDGLEAVEVFKKNPNEISLVIMDIGLPKLDGWEAYIRMKAMKPGLRVIVATGYLDLERINKLEASAHIIIRKPYAPDQILRKVREELDRSINKTIDHS